MPRYFFNVREGQDLSKNTEGQELADFEAAPREAIASTREILGDKMLHGGFLDNRTIEIADETGHVIDTVSTTDAVLKGGTFREYPDDVTQSAPKAPS